MKIEADLFHKPEKFWLAPCQVEQVVEITDSEFLSFLNGPLQEQPFLVEHSDVMRSQMGTAHCLLVLAEGRTDGVLVNAEGNPFACYAAYLPGARDIVSAELDRAVEHIVQEGTENTSTGNWIVYFDELKETLGLVLREGNGLAEMLQEKLAGRKEVLDVELCSDCVDTIYSSCFCPNLEDAMEREPDLSPARKAMLFNNTLSIALRHCGGEHLYARLHDTIGLTLEEIRTMGYLDEDTLRGVDALSRRVLKGGLSVRELLQLEEPGKDLFLMNDERNCRFSLDGLRTLADSGGMDLRHLLEAPVTDIQKAPNGTTNIVASGVGVEEMFRLQDAVQAQERAGQAMGPTM